MPARGPPAAAFSGVGVDILQQMLPLLAGITAGGLTKMAMSQGAMFAGWARRRGERADRAELGWICGPSGWGSPARRSRSRRRLPILTKK